MKKLFGKSDFKDCIRRFKKSIDAKLLKIMSKMGISVISSYRGGCNFEAVGLSRAIVSDYFLGMSSRISGIGVNGIEEKIKNLHEKFSKERIYSSNRWFISLQKKWRRTSISRTFNSLITKCR